MHADNFDALARTHAPRMLAVARRMVGAEEARDVVQDALLSAFRSFARFRGGAKHSTWLHRITINCALMRLRRRRSRPEVALESCAGEERGWAEEAIEAADARLERKQTHALVFGCVARLPDTLREIVVLRDVEELDTEEAAARLRITPAAAKVRLHRARRALRAELEGARAAS